MKENECFIDDNSLEWNVDVDIGKKKKVKRNEKKKEKDDDIMKIVNM